MRKILLPRGSKKYGVILLTIGTVLGILYLAGKLPHDWLRVNVPTFKGWISTDLTDELIVTLITFGGFIAGFTREEVEDEGIRDLRLSSLVWAVSIFLLLNWLGYMQLYQFDYVRFQGCLPFSIIYVYLIRFNFILSRRIKKQEKQQLKELLEKKEQFQNQD